MSIKVGNRTVFRYTLNDQDGDAVDISGATSKTIIFRSPHGTLYERTATLTGDGTDGVLETRFTQPAPKGMWRAEVYVAGVDGFDGASATDIFPVEARL